LFSNSFWVDKSKVDEIANLLLSLIKVDNKSNAFLLPLEASLSNNPKTSLPLSFVFCFRNSIAFTASWKSPLTIDSRAFCLSPLFLPCSISILFWLVELKLDIDSAVEIGWFSFGFAWSTASTLFLTTLELFPDSILDIVFSACIFNWLNFSRTFLIFSGISPFKALWIASKLNLPSVFLNSGFVKSILSEPEFRNTDGKFRFC